MFRHCEAPGFLPLADTNRLLAESRLDGFSTFLFRTLSVRQTIEIRRDRKPNRNVSQVAIQVGVPTGNKAARRAYGTVIKHLLPSASDRCAVHTTSRLVHRFSAVRSVPVHVHSESTGHVTVTVQSVSVLRTNQLCVHFNNNAPNIRHTQHHLFYHISRHKHTITSTSAPL